MGAVRRRRGRGDADQAAGRGLTHRDEGERVYEYGNFALLGIGV